MWRRSSVRPRQSDTVDVFEDPFPGIELDDHGILGSIRMGPSGTGDIQRAAILIGAALRPRVAKQALVSTIDGWYNASVQARAATDLEALPDYAEVRVPQCVIDAHQVIIDSLSHTLSFAVGLNGIATDEALKIKAGLERLEGHVASVYAATSSPELQQVLVGSFQNWLGINR